MSRIAKEGRKYGVFLGLVTQRPAELDATIISQCNTLFTMRLANDRDQALLRSAVSDAAANLLSFVPSLGTREVLAFGEGVALPTRSALQGGSGRISCRAAKPPSRPCRRSPPAMTCISSRAVLEPLARRDLASRYAQRSEPQFGHQRRRPPRTMHAGRKRRCCSRRWGSIPIASRLLKKPLR